MKLQREVSLDIPVREMECGQIGIITQWVEIPKHIGMIVQRNRDSLITLQKDWGCGWVSIPQNDNNRVRILQKGEILIIE